MHRGVLPDQGASRSGNPVRRAVRVTGPHDRHPGVVNQPFLARFSARFSSFDFAGFFFVSFFRSMPLPMSFTPVVIGRRRELKSVVAIRLEQVGRSLEIRNAQILQGRIVRARLE